MKYVKWIGIGLLCLLALFLYGKRQSKENQMNPPQALAKTDCIWLVTDIHYLAPDLHDEGKAFTAIQKTAAGKDIRYSKERMEALLEQVRTEKPAVLIVSGDVSLNGEKKSMEDLADYFHQMEESGTQVLVIPGNHDIASGWARAFKGEEQVQTPQMTKSNFEQVFAPFGLEEASQRDASSLSYLAKPFTDLWFLMIDSNIYAEGLGKGAPATNGRLKKETLVWIEQQLKDAQKAGVTLIPVMHHNALEHHALLTKGFTLDNAQDLLALYEKYGISLAFSGHIHTQHIAQEGELTEIVNGAFSMYPMTIGQLRVDDSTFSYEQTRLDMSLFEEAENPDLALHQAYLADLLHQSTDLLVQTSLYEEGLYETARVEQLLALLGPLNQAFFSGENLEEEWLDQMFTENPAYQTLLKEAPDSILVTYPQMIREEMKHQEVQKRLIHRK